LADITMPQLGETVTEGTITKWLKSVGDPIAEDDVLFEVSTDKVDSEVPSPVAGVLTKILVPEGETVDVGTRLAVISDSASPSAPEPGTRSADGTASGRELTADSAPESAAKPEPVAPAEPVVAPPAPRREPAPAAESAPTAGGLVLSPVVRRLIAEYQLDPTDIRGTGAGGRITRSDVLAVIDRRNGGGAAKTTPAPAARPAPATAAPVTYDAPAAEAGERDIVIPFTNIRRRTAEHMVRSKHTSAHTMVAVEVDYSAVENVRAAEKGRFREAEGFGLTYLPFVTRAVVDALEEFPNVNSSVGEDALIVHQDVNIGIAVDLDFEGLLVPVIHQADGKRLRVLAREISGLAAKARAKRLTMDDISGGTFTITNAGPFGTFITVPVINQPQVAILSTDGVRKRPVVVELPDGTDSIAIHPVGNLVMSWDHRAFDGAYASAFLRAIKTVVETRDWATEL
jgi:2-oxoglutarate dehydrogenase dihydrolipoamide succinyltransferase (E2 component)